MLRQAHLCEILLCALNLVNILCHGRCTRAVVFIHLATFILKAFSMHHIFKVLGIRRPSRSVLTSHLACRLLPRHSQTVLWGADRRRFWRSISLPLLLLPLCCLQRHALVLGTNTEARLYHHIEDLPALLMRSGFSFNGDASTGSIGCTSILTGCHHSVVPYSLSNSLTSWL